MKKKSDWTDYGVTNTDKGLGYIRRSRKDGMRSVSTLEIVVEEWRGDKTPQEKGATPHGIHSILDEVGEIDGVKIYKLKPQVDAA